MPDERNEIMAVLDAWDRALHDKDFDAFGKCYADDVIVFDVGAGIEGYDGGELVGYKRLRELWEACLHYFTDHIGVQRKNMREFIGRDVATLSFLSRMSGMAPTENPAAKSWFRTTVCLKRFNDGWKITHEHASLPIDANGEKPAYLFDD